MLVPTAIRLPSRRGRPRAPVDPGDQDQRGGDAAHDDRQRHQADLPDRRQAQPQAQQHDPQPQHVPQAKLQAPLVHGRQADRVADHQPEQQRDHDRADRAVREPQQRRPQPSRAPCSPTNARPSASTTPGQSPPASRRPGGAGSAMSSATPARPASPTARATRAPLPCSRANGRAAGRGRCRSCVAFVLPRETGPGETGWRCSDRLAGGAAATLMGDRLDIQGHFWMGSGPGWSTSDAAGRRGLNTGHRDSTIEAGDPDRNRQSRDEPGGRRIERAAAGLSRQPRHDPDRPPGRRGDAAVLHRALRQRRERLAPLRLGGRGGRRARPRAGRRRPIGAESREIVFTSGATESNNLAIKGAGPGRRSAGATTWSRPRPSTRPSSTR